MLPTFVIGLREGVEAALIVGIVAAFLRQQGRGDALRHMWLGVALAVSLCVAVAIALELVNEQLPQRQQEGLETVVALIAVGMVTYMIVWMRRHSADLAGDLRASAGEALALGSAWGLIAMAFFAVLREGFETAVFLLASFQNSGDALAAGLGAVVGIVVAIGIGYAIYKAGCGSTSAGSSSSPPSPWSSSPPACWPAPCTPRTRRPGGTACRARSST